MKVSLPYPQYEPIEIPDSNLVGIFEAPEFAEVPDVSAAIAAALTEPIGSPPLIELARGKRRVLILSDDYTRQTPVKEIIPILADRLADAGITRQDIRILVALGTHRPMTDEERMARFGEDLCRRFEIINHDWQSPDALVPIDRTSSGEAIRVNRLLDESDLVIGLGQIAPHRIAGYCGGSKIVVPGVCGEEAVAHTHWLGGRIPGERMLGVADNPVRAEMDAIAKKAGLAFIVNAVCDPKGRVIGIVAGDPVAAHRKGAALAREVFGAKVSEHCDIVIADSFPKDIELWQAAKALYAADLIVKPGGVVILVTLCPEGVSRSHPLILERGYHPEDETICAVRRGELTNMIVASHCLRVGRLIKDKATGIIVSKGIPRDDAEHLGFVYAETPQDALDQAFRIAGWDARVGVLRHGGEALPVLEGG